MSEDSPKPDSFTKEERAIVDAFLLGAGLVLKSLLRRDPNFSLKNLISGLSSQARDFVGVEFWKKHGVWLRDEIVKKAREIIGDEDGTAARP